MGDAGDADRARLETHIAALGLGPAATTHLRERWLEQLLWFEAKSARNQTEHRRFRTVTLVGSVVVPVLVNTATGGRPVWRVIATVASVIVGIVAALEGFQRPGERWLHYRQTAERLRSEWWLFVSSAGEYAAFGSLDAAHVRFVERVEQLVSDDVAGFVTIITQNGAPAEVPKTT